jgi:Ca-activated chloride channel homolog
MHTAHDATGGQDASSPFAIPADARGALAAGLRLILPIFLALAASFALPPRAQASSGREAVVRPGEMRAGSLLLRSTEPGAFVEAPRIGTDVDIAVSGPTARARVTQIFRNPTEGWVEAVYVYPLPEGGAVDSLKMVIGDRIVIGDIKERKKARAIYEEAKAAGRKTTLLEQERPNLFTNSVANIGPGETVLVQIEYQEPVRQSAGTFSLRVPLVGAPRYNPKPAVQAVDLAPGGQGWGTAGDPVLDRDRIEPPVLDPRVHGPTNPVSIAIRLQAGFPLGEVKSHHHDVRVETLGDAARVIKLGDGPVPADRDSS